MNVRVGDVVRVTTDVYGFKGFYGEVVDTAGTLTRVDVPGTATYGTSGSTLWPLFSAEFEVVSAW